MTVATALAQGTKILEDGAIAVPRLTAEVLLGFALQRERAYLYGHPEEPLPEVVWLHYGRYLHERLAGKPTQYITHRQEFYGREFRVSPSVLIPRPETEHVIEAALERAKDAVRVLDVGCGSGAIAVTLALELGRRVCGVDVSAAAIEVARDNSKRLRAPVNFFLGDQTAAIADRSLDLLVSNPPYVPESEHARLQREIREWEPRVALVGGVSGLDFYERLTRDAPRVLQAGGWLILELDYRAAEPVRAMLDTRWGDVNILRDLAGLPRVLCGRFEP
jgi:release factor glutamine methyltransferase